MKIVYNKFIPFKGFGLMNILDLVFSRRPEDEITLVSKRHEQTHTYQQYELLMIASIVSLVLCNIFASWWYLLGVLIIPFAIYIASFLLEAFIPPYHNAKECFEGKCFCDKIKAIPTWLGKVWMDAYSDNCFEREAYMNERNVNYHIHRRWCGWAWYILKKGDRKGK